MEYGTPEYALYGVASNRLCARGRDSWCASPVSERPGAAFMLQVESLAGEAMSRLGAHPSLLLPRP